MFAITIKEKHNKTDKVIQEFIINEPELNNLTSGQLDKLKKAVWLDDLKAKFKKEVQKAKFNEKEYIKKWLDKYESKETKRTFERNVLYFLNWLNDKSILDVNVEIVDEYLIYLKTTIKKKNTIRQRIIPLSSFFQSLVRYKKIDLNPFRNIPRLPTKERLNKAKEKIPNIQDICPATIKITLQRQLKVPTAKVGFFPSFFKYLKKEGKKLTNYFFRVLAFSSL